MRTNRTIRFVRDMTTHGSSLGEVGGGGGGGSTTPSNGYVAENGTTFYVAEDGATFYVQET